MRGIRGKNVKKDLIKSPRLIKIVADINLRARSDEKVWVSHEKENMRCGYYLQILVLILVPPAYWYTLRARALC